jgi:hypothetical protein
VMSSPNLARLLHHLLPEGEVDLELRLLARHRHRLALTSSHRPHVRGPYAQCKPSKASPPFPSTPGSTGHTPPSTPTHSCEDTRQH